MVTTKKYIQKKPHSKSNQFNQKKYRKFPKQIETKKYVEKIDVLPMINRIDRGNLTDFDIR